MRWILATLLLPLSVLACGESSPADAGLDSSTDAASLNELLELAITGMEGHAQVTEHVCECGYFCGTIMRITTEQASCFYAQAGGDTETFRRFFEAQAAYSADVVACYDEMGCVRPETCALAPPELLRNPPAFYVRGLAICL